MSQSYQDNTGDVNRRSMEVSMPLKPLPEESLPASASSQSSQLRRWSGQGNPAPPPPSVIQPPPPGWRPGVTVTVTEPGQRDGERQTQNAPEGLGCSPSTPLRPSTPQEAITTRTTANEDAQQTEPTSSRRLAGLQNAFKKGKGVWQRRKADFQRLKDHLKGGSRRGGGAGSHGR
jgi:hypothetical protein